MAAAAALVMSPATPHAMGQTLNLDPPARSDAARTRGFADLRAALAEQIEHLRRRLADAGGHDRSAAVHARRLAWRRLAVHLADASTHRPETTLILGMGCLRVLAAGSTLDDLAAADGDDGAVAAAFDAAAGAADRLDTTRITDWPTLDDALGEVFSGLLAAAEAASGSASAAVWLAPASEEPTPHDAAPPAGIAPEAMAAWEMVRESLVRAGGNTATSEAAAARLRSLRRAASTIASFHADESSPKKPPASTAPLIAAFGACFIEATNNDPRLRARAWHAMDGLCSLIAAARAGEPVSPAAADQAAYRAAVQAAFMAAARDPSVAPAMAHAFDAARPFIGSHVSRSVDAGQDPLDAEITRQHVPAWRLVRTEHAAALRALFAEITAAATNSSLLNDPRMLSAVRRARAMFAAVTDFHAAAADAVTAGLPAGWRGTVGPRFPRELPIVRQRLIAAFADDDARPAAMLTLRRFDSTALALAPRRAAAPAASLDAPNGASAALASRHEALFAEWVAACVADPTAPAPDGLRRLALTGDLASLIVVDASPRRVTAAIVAPDGLEQTEIDAARAVMEAMVNALGARADTLEAERVADEAQRRAALLRLLARVRIAAPSPGPADALAAMVALPPADAVLLDHRDDCARLSLLLVELRQALSAGDPSRAARARESIAPLVASLLHALNASDVVPEP